MKFSIAAATLALAAVAAAAPSYFHPEPHVGNNVDIETEKNTQSAQNICGQAKLQCCTQENDEFNIGDHSDKQGLGILTSLAKNGIKDIGIFGQCSDLNVNVPVIGGALQNILNDECSATAACCQNSPSTANGFAAVALPCIPVANLI